MTLLSGPSLVKRSVSVNVEISFMSVSGFCLTRGFCNRARKLWWTTSSELDSSQRTAANQQFVSSPESSWWRIRCGLSLHQLKWSLTRLQPAHWQLHSSITVTRGWAVNQSTVCAPHPTHCRWGRERVHRGLACLQSKKKIPHGRRVFSWSATTVAVQSETPRQRKKNNNIGLGE